MLAANLYYRGHPAYNKVVKICLANRIFIYLNGTVLHSFAKLTACAL